MDFFNVVSLNECTKIIESNFKFYNEKISVSLEESLGMAIAENVIASFSLPQFNRSTVDGYAIHAEDSFGATDTSPSLLTVISEIKMGELSDISLKKGEAVYVPTGAMIPKSCSGVVMIEYIEKIGNEILISKGISENSNMVLEGSEILKSEPLIKEGTQIKTSHIAVMSSMGISSITVYKHPTFYIISTGDELVDITDKPQNGEIFDINTYAIQGIINSFGGKVLKKVLVKDNPLLLKSLITDGINSADIVIISGGSSVGTKDYTKNCIIGSGGDILVHGLGIKPGKPTIIGKASNKLIVGLPGHPLSAITVFKYLTDIIFNNKRKIVLGKLAENINGDPGKTVFVNVILNKKSDLSCEDFIEIIPIHTKSSMVKPLLLAEGYIMIPPHKEGLYKGETVEVMLND